MASVTKSTDGTSMADEDQPDDQEETTGESPKGAPGKSPSGKKVAPRGSGYFTLYKKGQGYWTRIGTLFAGILICVFTAYNLYVQVTLHNPWHEVPAGADLAHYNAMEKVTVWTVTAIFLALFAWLAWTLQNKPRNVDFLIATDSEMKKVNWTSRKELIGSTKIVIIFMFLIAIFLFAVDWIFSCLMWLLKVMSVPPPGL